MRKNREIGNSEKNSENCMKSECFRRSGFWVGFLGKLCGKEIREKIREIVWKLDFLGKMVIKLKSRKSIFSPTFQVGFLGNHHQRRRQKRSQNHATFTIPSHNSHCPKTLSRQHHIRNDHGKSQYSRSQKIY